MTTKSNNSGTATAAWMGIAGIAVALSCWLISRAGAETPAAQTASAAGKPKGGTLIWAAPGRKEGGKPIGKFLYSVAADKNGVYVVGDSTKGTGIIEKLNPRDGSLMWPNYQVMKGTREGMHLAINKEFLFAVGEPWTIEKRKLTDGSLVWSKKSEGGKPYVVTLDSTAAYMGGHQWQVESRSLDDGHVIWSKKGPSGVVLGAAVDSTGVYFGGYDKAAPGDNQWRMEKRSLKDGSLIWEQTLNPSKKADQVYGVAVDATGVYAAGIDETEGTGGQARIEKRSLTDGKLIWEQKSNPTPGLDKAHGLTIDSTGLYIPGYQGGSTWRIEKRSLKDGSLIWMELSVSGRLWYAVGVDDDSVYVGGNAGGGGHSGVWRIEKRAK